METRKRILLKLTGKAFLDQKTNALSSETIRHIAAQIRTLRNRYLFGIVVGGGNILRGEEQGQQIGLTPTYAHQTGMLATVINSLILQNIFKQEQLETALLSALFCPQICPALSQQKVDESLKQNDVIIFAGGTGAPFVTTDTNAIIRGLQIEAKQVWKGTDTDGIYSSDPKKNPDSILEKELQFFDVIEKNLGIMDIAAVALAEKHKMEIRVFDIFEKNALIKASEDTSFGSLISVTVKDKT